MRFSIQLQLLVPMLSAVLVAIAIASAASSYLGSSWAKRQQQENLARVVTTLADARFPLTDGVLQQMSGLSGAQFVLLDARGAIVRGTVQASAFLQSEGASQALAEAPALAEIASRPEIQIAGDSYLAARVPLKRPAAEGPVSLVVLLPADRWWTAGREAALPPLVAGAVAALVAAIATAMLAKRWVRPIELLGKQAEQIAGGDFAPCELPSRNDEIRDLSLSLDRMRSRLSQYETQVRRSERLRTLGQLGAGLAHQLRNWATGARMALDLHRRECSATRGDESLDVASRQLTFIESYLHRFLSLGRGSDGPRRPLELGSLVDDVLSLVRPVCDHAKVELRCHATREPIWIEGEAESLRDALVNLALNAVDAARQGPAGGGSVCLEIERRGSRVGVCVKDTGPGPSADVAERVFEPFVSNKRDGAGLGLSVARQTVEEHGGEVRWRREDGLTVFAIELPLASTPLERALLPMAAATSDPVPQLSK